MCALKLTNEKRHSAKAKKQGHRQYLGGGGARGRMGFDCIPMTVEARGRGGEGHLEGESGDGDAARGDHLLQELDPHPVLALHHVAWEGGGGSGIKAPQPL